MPLLTPSVWPFLRPRAFCAGMELDMYVHVPGRIHRREVSQMTTRSRDHHLFLHAAGSLCKVCVQAWLDRGADTSKGTPWEPMKSAFRWAEEAQADEALLSMLSVPAGEWCPFTKQPSCCFSVPEVAAQRGDVVSFSDFWSFGADDQDRGAAVASAALRGDLEMLNDTFESDDCSIFNQRPGVEEANLPDVLEHWILREYVELALLRAATGLSRRRNLQSVLLWLEGREPMEAFDFAFGPMKEPELDGLQKLTLTGKIFHVFSLQNWKSQLRLIDGCYKGHQNMVSVEGRCSRRDQSFVYI